MGLADGSPRPHPPHPQPVSSGRWPHASRTGGWEWAGALPWTPHTQRERCPTPARPRAAPTGREASTQMQSCPQGGERPQARQGDKGTGPPPQKLNRRSMGPGQETRRGTNRLERPYRRPAPEPRVVRAPHRPGGARTLREQERTHTQRTHGTHPKGNRTEPAEGTDCMEWRTGRRTDGTLGRDNPQHAPRGTRGQGGAPREKREPAPAPTTQACRERRAHTIRALHLPRL